MQLNIFDATLTPAHEADVLSLPSCPICSGKLRVNSVILSCENPDHYGILCRGELVRDESGNYKEPVAYVAWYDKTTKRPGQIAPPEFTRTEAWPELIDALNPALVKRGHTFIDGGNFSLNRVLAEIHAEALAAFNRWLAHV